MIRDKKSYLVWKDAISTFQQDTECMSVPMKEMLINSDSECFAQCEPSIEGFIIPKKTDIPYLLSELKFQLNKSQQQAMEMSMHRTFTLCQGPPGTGKTYFGARLIASLLHHNKKHVGKHIPILVTCESNAAADHFLDLLVGVGVKNIVRIAGTHNPKVSEKAVPYLLCNQQTSEDESLRTVLAKSDVIISTNNGAIVLSRYCRLFFLFCSTDDD